MRDFKSNLLVDMLLNSNGIWPEYPGAGWVAATYTGTGRDAQRATSAICSVAALIGNATSFTLTLEDSADNSTWATLGASKYGTGSAPAAITADGDYYFTAKNFRRYLRAKIVVVGGDGSTATIFAHIALDRGASGPITQWSTEI